jgi:hypothetical protein
MRILIRWYRMIERFLCYDKDVHLPLTKQRKEMFISEDGRIQKWQ